MRANFSEQGIAQMIKSDKGMLSCWSGMTIGHIHSGIFEKFFSKQTFETKEAGRNSLGAPSS
jgi:hypothetical protein